MERNVILYGVILTLVAVSESKPATDQGLAASATPQRTTTIDYDLADLDEFGTDPGMIDTINFADDGTPGLGYGAGGFDANEPLFGLSPTDDPFGGSGAPVSDEDKDPDVLSAEDMSTTKHPTPLSANDPPTLTGNTEAARKNSSDMTTNATPENQYVATDADPTNMHSNPNKVTSAMADPSREIVKDNGSSGEKSKIITRTYTISKKKGNNNNKNNKPSYSTKQQNVVDNDPNLEEKSVEVSKDNQSNKDITTSNENKSKGYTNESKESDSAKTSNTPNSSDNVNSGMDSSNNSEANDEQSSRTNTDDVSTNESSVNGISNDLGSIHNTADKSNLGMSKHTDMTEEKSNNEQTNVPSRNSDTVQDSTQHDKTMSNQFKSVTETQTKGQSSASVESHDSNLNVSPSVSTDVGELSSCFADDSKQDSLCNLARSLHAICMSQFSRECSQGLQHRYGGYAGHSESKSTQSSATVSSETVERISASFEKASGIYEILSLIHGVCPSLCSLALESSSGKNNANGVQNSEQTSNETNSADGQDSQGIDFDFSLEDTNDSYDVDTKIRNGFNVRAPLSASSATGMNSDETIESSDDDDGDINRWNKRNNNRNSYSDYQLDDDKSYTAETSFGSMDYMEFGTLEVATAEASNGSE